MEHFAGIIIAISSFCGALLVIIGFLKKIYKTVKSFDDWREEKDKSDNDQYLAILRLTVMSQEMPISERISAGDKYIKCGGNGIIKHKYEELLNTLPKDHE